MTDSKIDTTVPAFLQCSECGFGQHADRRTGTWYSSAWLIDSAFELRFQCCPQHARQASEKFAPIEVEGFERWEDPQHSIEPDHVVAAKAEDLDESGASLINKYVHSKGRELSPQTPFGLSETIKNALEIHKARPLKWVQIDPHTERAQDPVTGEWFTRPYLSEAHKVAIRSSAATLAEAMQEAGDGPQRALEGFLKAVRGNDERMEPLYAAPGPAALEDRETYGFIRKSLASAIGGFDIDDDVIAKVRATAFNVVSGVLGDRGSIESMDIDVTKDGQLNINMDLSYAPSAPAKEILIKFHEEKTTPELLETQYADGPGTAFGRIRDIVAEETRFAREQLENVQAEIAELRTSVSFLNIQPQPEPILKYTAILPGAKSVTVKLAPEWDQGFTTASHHYPTQPYYGNGSWELDLSCVYGVSDGRHLVLFEGDNGVTHQQYLTYRNCEWFLG